MKCKDDRIDGVPTEWKGASKNHTLELMYGNKREELVEVPNIYPIIQPMDTYRWATINIQTGKVTIVTDAELEKKIAEFLNKQENDNSK